jgi:Tol biopolymer transport system component
VTHDFSHYAAVRATADGKTLLAVQDQVASTIQVIAPASESEARTISAGNLNLDGVQALAWTPEGKLLYGSEPDQRGEIWEMGRDGSSPRRLVRVNAPAAFSGLAVSPRGDFIAVARWSDDDVASIWRMDLNGHDQMQLTSAKQDFPPSITPDGQWVVYGSVQQDKSVLMKVPSKGGAPIRLADYAAQSPSVSPDGLRIACITSTPPDQLPSLTIVPLAGGKPEKTFQLPHTASPLPLVWTSDGRAVAFISNIDGVSNIFAQPLAGGPVTAVTHFSSGKIFNFQWSREGLLALSRGTEAVDAVMIRNFR